jgi:DNA-binding NtrC family response regulator
MVKKKLLLVDDMEWVYEDARIKVGDRYSIAHARNQTEALKMMQHGAFDRVITDYHLGGNRPNGGLTVMKAAIERELPVTLMSMENHKTEASKQGVPFIFKRDLIKYIRDNI